MPCQQPITSIARAGLLLSLLAVLACSKAPPPLPGAAQASLPNPLSSAASPPSAAQPDDASWGGFLSERLAHGMVYINDADARDSTSAFEAVLITEPTPPGAGPDRPEGVEAYWKPTVNQVLAVGNKILAEIEPTVGGSAPSYRYLLIAGIEGGKRRILAQALCEDPAWWRAQVGQSKLCQRAGSCAHVIPAALRNDCQLRFSYDVETEKLSRSPTR